jgi:FixJ family two-component response regulator
MRKSVERLLMMQGFVTEGYASAEGFLKRSAVSQIDCLVLDIHFDGMSGIELRRCLIAAGSTVPVIFISAVDDALLEQEALQTGCVAYLHKPFRAASLISAINKTLADHASS